MKQLTYKEARTKMKPGDVIGFGGKGFVSAAIKTITHCQVSHVGIIFQAQLPTWKDGFINQIIESTSLGDGFAGVQINRMSLHIKKYDGEIWWLPLSDDARAKLNQTAFFNFLLDQVGKKYDAPQAIGSALDLLPDQQEDFDKLFCSELNTAALEKGGVLSDINASEQTPADNCRFNIYSEACQIKGDPKEIFG